ncbi:MAG: hypothetical protein RR324_08675 [Cellulosilyticaceae bacterium]|uniref:SHOCT-like domain-containing protein n=1 Tax=Niameybacter sp. TaxID=2033640 RepID=UPI002FCC0755
MNEEVKRILKMVEEGKISADKAKDLMEALENVSAPVVSTKSYEDKFLRVKVLSADGDKVNIQLPIKVIKAILNVTGKLPVDTLNIKGVNTEELIETIVSCLDSEVMGEIVSVDSADGDIVRIVIE